MNHSYSQHKRLYGLLKETNTDRYRHEMVYSFSDGRTENSADLSDLEILDLIRHLEKFQKVSDKPTLSGVDRRGHQMRRRILSLCYTMDWTKFVQNQNRHVVDFDRLNRWLIKYGYLHKPLNEYKYTELPTLVTQFENMARSVLKEK